ncbi:hypothetical protein TREES_T100006166 [Tupaia chinensis]|uniref:Uncharacterized protein n=1 Tax=Tupaia chinensis TaxID=246437 RepID=L9LBY5_TUPCH|nr:hypothetical protein TREES_T100006166 [Tupaia chinensis]
METEAAGRSAGVTVDGRSGATAQLAAAASLADCSNPVAPAPSRGVVAGSVDQGWQRQPYLEPRPWNLGVGLEVMLTHSESGNKMRQNLLLRSVTV